MIVAVQFKGAGKDYNSQRYSYHTDLPLKIGDEVIVDSPSSGLVVVKVVAVSGNYDGTSASKWVVQKVDRSEYDRREEERRRKVVIETKLRAIEKEVEASYKYKYLAAVSPEAAELIRELESIK